MWCVCAVVSLCASGALAAGTFGPGLYQIHDHGNATLGPDYGLRVDALNAIFSTDLGGADVTLFWDGGSTALLSGLVHHNSTNELWGVSYTITGVVADGTVGFYSTGGNGTLTDPLNNVTVLTGEQDNGGEAFRIAADGHRLPGDSDSIVGRGWLLPPNSIDDWIIQAELIPEPASLALLGCGAVAMLARRR